MIAGRVLVAMPAMHEKMQERAQEQKRIRQNTEEMRGVFGDQKESGDSEESN